MLPISLGIENSEGQRSRGRCLFRFADAISFLSSRSVRIQKTAVFQKQGVCPTLACLIGPPCF
jgi:hypothetical protein